MTIATQLAAAAAELGENIELIKALAAGPSSGEGSLVDGPSGPLPTMARLAVEAAAGGGHTGPVIAVLGDSIMARNTTNTETQKSYNIIGPVTWLRVLSRGYFTFPIENNFGVVGDNLAEILVRAPDVVAAQPDWCFVLGGANDVPEGRTFAAMQADMIAILQALLGAGIQVVVLHIMPRDALTAPQKHVRQRFNRWLTEVGLGRVAVPGVPTGVYPIVVNANPYIADQSTGEWLSGYDSGGDGVHPGNIGAYWTGYALWEALSPMLPVRYRAWADYNDAYDATSNPNGNMLGTAGLFAGSGGTITPSGNFSGSGTFAAGWTMIASATSTTALVASKESPRTDGPNSGERQRLVFTTTVAGGATEVYQMYKVCTDAAAGDTVQFEVAYELMSHVGVTAIDLQLRQDGGTPIQSAFDNSPINTPMVNIPHKGVLRTPPMTLQPGTTSVTAYIQFRMNATSGASSLDVKLSDASVHKLL